MFIIISCKIVQWSECITMVTCWVHNLSYNMKHTFTSCGNNETRSYSNLSSSCFLAHNVAIVYCIVSSGTRYSSLICIKISNNLTHQHTFISIYIHSIWLLFGIRQVLSVIWSSLVLSWRTLKLTIIWKFTSNAMAEHLRSTSVIPGNPAKHIQIVEQQFLQSWHITWNVIHRGVNQTM